MTNFEKQNIRVLVAEVKDGLRTYDLFKSMMDSIHVV